MDAYRRWIHHPALDPETKEELMQLKDPREMEDRFGQTLTFGTAGLRGIIGAGTNRMNIYTVRRATEGFARYLLDTHPDAAKRQGIVIAYDSRQKSPEFAQEAAGVLAYHGIPVHLFPELRPTPMLSFAVRHLKAAGGIVITASHNPPEYNGYKVYGPDGGQLLPDAANRIFREIEQIEDEISLPSLSLEEGKNKGWIHFVGSEVDDAYFAHLKTLPLQPEIIREMGKQIRIVYTPLHGTGNHPVRRILSELGFSELTVVSEQADPDPTFSTVQAPNPEERKAFQMALDYAERLNADLILGTDPDADRLGAMVLHQGEYVTLTGNQIGALMLHYLLSQKSAQNVIPPHATCYKTIVTSELGRKVAESYGVRMVDLLTGFKYIAEQIRLHEKSRPFLFGYEESYGYLIGDFVRDKDAIQAAMMMAEMVAYHKKQGQTLVDVLESLFARHGVHLEDLLSFTFTGTEGRQKMDAMLREWRQSPPAQLGAIPIIRLEDYSVGLHGLPPANAIKFLLANEAWVALRPSGTEPKMKCYIGVASATKKEAEDQLLRLKQDILRLMNRWL